MGRLTQTLQVIQVFLTTLSTLIILLVGSGYIMDGVITVGTFVAFQSLMASFSQPITSLVYLGSALQDVEGGLVRIEDVYNYPFSENEIVFNTSKVAAKNTKLEGYVGLKNVTFGYSPLEEPLITDFSISLKPETRGAIVGRSGCGKSTIANLVSGLYEPWKGEVLLGSKPRQSIS